MIRYNLPPDKQINTYPPSNSNQITKDYYNTLIGEINRGVISKAICRIENSTFDNVSYYLISQR